MAFGMLTKSYCRKGVVVIPWSPVARASEASRKPSIMHTSELDVLLSTSLNGLITIPSNGEMF